MIDYTKIPERFVRSLNDYAQKGVPPGGFLQACLSNDLKGAFGRADNEALPAMEHIVGYIYNRIPSICQGSRERVAAWIEGGGADSITGPGSWEPEPIE